MFENKKIFIFGMARSGYEIAKLLSKYNNEIIITDAKDQDIEHVKELEQLGVKVVITSTPEDLLDDTYSYVVKNPGIKYDNPLCLKANNLNIPLINELEVCYSLLPKNIKIIGVTGSNGKTTTVTLIYEMLKEDGISVHLCGNIGIPLSSKLEEIKEGDTLVLEISDHQLCDMYKFKTDISVLTNISKTHLDFHDSYDRYKAIKKRIFNNHTTSSLAILNNDYKEVIDLTEDINSKKEYFSLKEKKDSYIKNGIIYYKDEKIVQLSDIKLKGDHNLENIMASIMVCKNLNVKNESIINVLKEFKGVEHRIEYVDTKNGVSFYNDSKSTNNKATQTALKSFSTPVILILGGLDRGQSFDELGDFVKHVKRIECYGETKARIYLFANKYDIPCSIFETLKEAFKDAVISSSPGDTVLLSPACASWDQYKCFEDRGEEFKKYVNEL